MTPQGRLSYESRDMYSLFLVVQQKMLTSTFTSPACPTCLADPPLLANGSRLKVETDSDGAWLTSSTAGVLKPAVVMFGESIAASVKTAAEEAIDTASRILVIGSSLATYSAWRLVKRALERGMPIGILNLGGVRGEEAFFNLRADNNGSLGVRCSDNAESILPSVVRKLELIAVAEQDEGSNIINTK